MSVQEVIREKLRREPFEAFRIVTSSGEAYAVPNPDLIALMRSEIFVAQPNSDRHAFIPLLHVTAVETIANGKKARRGKPRG